MMRYILLFVVLMVIGLGCVPAKETPAATPTAPSTPATNPYMTSMMKLPTYTPPPEPVVTPTNPAPSIKPNQYLSENASPPLNTYFTNPTYQSSQPTYYAPYYWNNYQTTTTTVTPGSVTIWQGSATIIQQ
jgi:hypothetical protein